MSQKNEEEEEKKKDMPIIHITEFLIYQVYIEWKIF